MVTVRLHLDDCDEGNGPLQVLAGSHQEGVLTPAAIDAWRARVEPSVCCVPAGGVLLMRPLPASRLVAGRGSLGIGASWLSVLRAGP